MVSLTASVCQASEWRMPKVGLLLEKFLEKLITINEYTCFIDKFIHELNRLEFIALGVDVFPSEKKDVHGLCKAVKSIKLWMPRNR